MHTQAAHSVTCLLAYICLKSRDFGPQGWHVPECTSCKLQHGNASVFQRAETFKHAVLHVTEAARCNVQRTGPPRRHLGRRRRLGPPPRRLQQGPHPHRPLRRPMSQVAYTYRGLTPSTFYAMRLLVQPSKMPHI